MSQIGKHFSVRKEYGRQLGVLTLLAWFSVAIPASPSRGQAPQQQPPPAADLSANIGQISFDLVVHDKRGRPVLDLRPEEIAVTDDNAPVTVTSLRLVTGNRDGENLITLLFDRPALPPGVRMKADGFILKTERETAAKILKMIPEKGYSVSVLSVEGRLQLQQGFTSDRNALAQAINAAIEQQKPGSGGALNRAEQELGAMARTGADSSGKAVSAADRVLDHALFSALVSSGRIAQDQHIRSSLAGLLALAQSQQRIAQRKAVIYFTSLHDKQIDSHDKDAINSIIGTANRAGMSISIVDLNSTDRDSARIWAGSQVLASAMQQSVNSAAVNSGSSVGSNQYGADMQNSARRMQTEGADPNLKRQNEQMQHLAEGTGGRYITGDSLRKSTQQAIQDLQNYYEFSYLSPIKEYDGKFHSVAVKPLRAGLKLRSQEGYIAVPLSAGEGANPQPFELPLLKILSEPQLPADLSFRAGILAMGDTPEGHIAALAIEVPLSSLEIRDDATTNLSSAHVSIVANVKDPAGTLIERFSADIPHRGIPTDTESKKFEVISLQRHFSLPPGQYILETAVLDRNSGKAGAQRMTFEVPNATAMPSLSNMVLVRKTEPFRGDDDPSEPLRYGNEKVTPNLSGQLSPGAKDISVFFVVHFDPSAPQAPTLNLQVLRDGKLLGSAPLADQKNTGSEFSSYLTTFSVNPPMNGQYEVKAILTQGAKTVEAAASFALTGIQIASVDPVDPEGATIGPLKIPDLPAGSRAITFPANPIQRPAADALKSILADATQNALRYKDSLPNFTCEQVTDRSVNLQASSQWQHNDRITELLTYLDHEEHRTLLELDQNGLKSHSDTEALRGVLSIGEFGAAITSLFRPSSKAEFQWKETGELGDGTVQVFDYRVARENSIFHLRADAQLAAAVGSHGQVFIDSATHSVRRITAEADDLPKNFMIHAASISVDFDYVAINNHDYLLPVSAQVVLRRGRKETDLNEIEFRNFHRFSSNARILYSPQEVGP
jgi:VWFA-related protein